MKLLCAGRRSYKSAFFLNAFPVLVRKKEVSTLFFSFCRRRKSRYVAVANEGHPRSFGTFS